MDFVDFEWMVADEFSALAGLDETDRRPFLPFCISAAHQIKTRLMPGVTLKDNARALCTAAAATAFYRYVLLRSAMDEESFKAGDVAVSKNAQAEKTAKLLRDDAIVGIAHLLQDTDFVFRQVM